MLTVQCLGCHIKVFFGTFHWIIPLGKQELFKKNRCLLEKTSIFNGNVLNVDMEKRWAQSHQLYEGPVGP